MQSVEQPILTPQDLERRRQSAVEIKGEDEEGEKKPTNVPSEAALQGSIHHVLRTAFKVSIYHKGYSYRLKIDTYIQHTLICIAYKSSMCHGKV